MISAFTARGLLVVMLIIPKSEVKLVCVRIPRVSTRVRHWSQCRKNVDISLAHTQRSAAIAQPIPIQGSQWQCGLVREHQLLCGDWLVRQTISVCNNPITCTARAYVCSDVLNSDGHIELGTVWAMDPKSCSLPCWTHILRIQQHIVRGESRGST